MAKAKPNNPKLLTKPGVHGYGEGLYLQIRDANRRAWIFRYSLHGKARWMGLGALDDVPLAEAREAAAFARKLLRAGHDPIETRRAKAVVSAAPMPATRTFESVALAYIAKTEADWKNEKHRSQWKATLTSYVYPVIGAMDVAEVDTAAVRRVLDPIWREKPETASRVRGRIETILDYAEAEAWRTGDNPARLTKRLTMLLGEHGPKAKVKHHTALPWQEIGGCMAKLVKQNGVSALALRFTVLTATRTSETLNSTWGEISLDGRDGPIWTIPGERMKAGRTHRVPLSTGALEVLKEAAMLRTKKDHAALPVFPGRQIDKPLSNMALLMLLRRIEYRDLTTHGFRSTFRDWCAEASNFPREIAEAALSHVLKDKTEAAYQRGDLLEKRRKLMEDWSTFCGAPVASASDQKSNC